jgi:hypothetical protein
LREKEKAEERKEREKWHGLASMGRYTARLKSIMRREGVGTFRKGGRKLEHKVKERIGKEKHDEKNKEEEGVVYKVNCKKCKKIYRRNKV